MPNFINLPPFTEDGDVHVVVETPRGSRAKFAYVPKLETFILSKSFLTRLTYPHDWGSFPCRNTGGVGHARDAGPRRVRQHLDRSRCPWRGLMPIPARSPDSVAMATIATVGRRTLALSAQ